MDKQDVVQIKNITKIYHLYRKKQHRLIEAIHPLRKKYHRDFHALRNINLNVAEGEIVGIVGRNGSGKSTLLKIIAGVLTPTSGQVQTKGSIVALLELTAGFNPDFTGLDNIYFFGALMGYTKSDMDDLVEEIIEFAELGDFIYQPLKTYSSGMKARLAFSTSIMIDPEILILDEVLAVGDELFKRKCYAKIEDLFNAGKTIFFVSHSGQSVKELCTRVILLHQGEILLDGPSKLVVDYYQKLLYSTPDTQKKVLNEIAELNANEKLKQLESVEHFEDDGYSSTVGQPDGAAADSAEYTSKSYYLEKFIPKSTVVYQNFDVDIHSAKILDSRGIQVNQLIPNNEYVYSYKVRFGEAADNVNFGMKIKTLKGFEIVGGSNPGKPHVEPGIARIEGGCEYEIRWEFRCDLFPGDYFLNAGVFGIIDGVETYLCRVIDITVFRVLESGSRLFTGITNLVSNVEIAEQTG